MDADTAEQTPLDQLRLVARTLLDRADFEPAATAWAELWRRTGEPEAASAFLACPRRLNRYNEALALADELNGLFPNSPACRRQVLKAWLHGRFFRHDPGCPLEQLIACAEPLLSPRRKWAWPLVTLTVMEEAARARRWDLVKAWAAKSDPALLRGAQRPERDGEMNPQASWYDCLLKALRGTGRAAAALALLDRMPEPPPPVRDRFLRHRLYAYLSLDSPHDALAICAEFGRRQPPERWALVLGARLLSDLDEIRAAMVLLCRALLYTGTPGETGTIMIDLSDLMIRIGWTGIALKQLRLVLKQYRDHGWTVPPRLYALQAAAEANCVDPGKDYAHDPNTLRDCLEIWSREASRHIELRRDVNNTRRVQDGLLGTLQLQSAGWAVRMANGFMAACAPADVPRRAKPGSEVIFDAVPAFNRFIGVETWRAINVRLTS
jgi:tetratricopeptide (TPR) repeat protein